MTTCAQPAAAESVSAAGGGMGSGYGHGIGSGFGGFIGELRRKGLDVVLVIDGTGSMKLIIDDVKAKMEQLVQSIHRLVPIARIGIIVFGGKGETMNIQPLTLSPQKLSDFLNSIRRWAAANGKKIRSARARRLSTRWTGSRTRRRWSCWWAIRRRTRKTSDRCSS